VEAFLRVVIDYEHLAAPVFVQTFDPRLNLLLLARLADVKPGTTKGLPGFPGRLGS
jgi:hypothetical protein